jgi:ElaB/YqjD/DUF883 family membrane-anchored ribosome-binding protein
MASMEKIHSSTDTAEEQIAKLRAQVETLMNERVTPMVANAAGRAESAVHSAAGAVRQQADAISGQVREQPLLAVLLAAGIGVVVGRLLR